MLRTDLTIESISMVENVKGITQKFRGELFKVTEVTISDSESSQLLGKKVGRYVTLESDNICKPTADIHAMAKELSKELGEFIPKGSVLVVGLGNQEVTPDTLGVRSARGVLATRCFTVESPKDPELSALREVSVITAGVLSQTGIESSEIVKSLADTIHPNSILVIDSFACSDISRLGTTVQISNTGIHPGSGVNNSRKEISQEVMGVPVIAMGVPTVVDMHTIVENLTGTVLQKDVPNLMVTPKDIDNVISTASQLLSESISMVLFPQCH